MKHLYLVQDLDQDRLDDREYIEEEKRLIMQTIRYMTKVGSLLNSCDAYELMVGTQDEILEPVLVPEEGVGFIIHCAEWSLLEGRRKS